jgi:hypothetical protein
VTFSLDQQSIFLLDPTKIYDPEPEVHPCFTNDYGSIRRCKVLSEYNIKNINLKDVIDLYRTWRDDPEYFILRGLQIKPGDQQRLIRFNNEFEDSWYTPDEFEYLYKFVKASKRGNDIYQHLVTNKLKPLRELPDYYFFNDHDGDKRTSLLFITLTYDNKHCSVKEAWEHKKGKKTGVGNEFHLFINNLKKHFSKEHYGKKKPARIEFMRTWESTNSYYPHVHCIILFKDHSFPVIEHKDKDGEISYRIPYHIKQEIGEFWHSNIDIQAIQNTQGAINELTKYITKDLCSSKGDVTNSMIWLFGKQGYSISKGFVKSIYGWDLSFNEPTNTDLINQMCNWNHDVVVWEFLGILRGKHLGFSPQVWCVDLKKPPPRVIDMVILEQKRWALLHGGR